MRDNPLTASARRMLAIFFARNREFYRDTAGLGWNILMPVLMILAFAFLFDSGDAQLFTVGLLGEQPTAPAAQALRAIPQLRVVPVQDPAAGQIKIARHQLDLLLDPGEPNAADPPVGYWINPESARGAVVERLLLGALGTCASDATPALLRQPISGAALRYADWALPGVLAMNVMFSSLWGVGWVVVRYRKNGVLRRLKATPLRPAEFLAAQVLSRLIVVLTASALVYLGAVALLAPPMRGSYLALALVYAAGALCMISLGLTVAARLRTEELADGILNLISWPMLLLSGVWFSLEGASPAAQAAAQAMPLTYLVDAARLVMLDGAGVREVLPQIGLLLAIAAGLMSVAALLFRWE